MSVHFKFRSSPNYDSVDIGGQPSISVRDLKSRIVQNKKLNLSQDFDLLFSDPISAREYVDEDFEIPCGSSVIIKRIPAGDCVGSLKSLANTNTKITKTSHPENVETIDFDDFGEELCPLPEVNLSVLGDKETNNGIKRCSEQPVVECNKFEASDISEAIAQGQNVSETRSKPDIKLNKELPNFPAIQTTGIPSELTCSLCHTYFKEAVMIPCCQHSFCEKCIHHVLVEKARCPKCFSTKCKVEHLLPNVSLRQAIESFLKSQFFVNGSENALHQDAPDGESGIQVKDVSCAVSVLQREAAFSHSPSGTGRGSNQIPAELPVHKMRQITEDLDGFADFQGENQPTNEEAESNFKKRALWVNPADAENICVEAGRPKKVRRACYMCGSPGHLRRDCPAVYTPHPILQRGNAMFPGAMPGYVSAYWNGPPFPHVRPFGNPYINSGMIPFNAAVIPASPFPPPTYMPSMFGGSPTFGGFNRIGGMTGSVKNNVADNLFCSELDAKDHNKRNQFTSQDVMRERSANYSEDSLTKRSFSKRLHPHTISDVDSDDRRHERSTQAAGQNSRPSHHWQRSRSEVDDLPCSSSWHSEERDKGAHRSSKKHHDQRELCDSDSCCSHYPTNKENDVKRKTVKHDSGRWHRKHYSHSESSLELSHSTDKKKKRREKDSSRCSTHSGRKSKSTHDKLSHDRWQMAGCSNEDNQEDYGNYRRKRDY